MTTARSSEILDGALVVYEESAQINRELRAQPGSVKAQRDLGLAMYRFGAALQERGDLDDALAVSGRGDGAVTGLAQARPESAQAQRDLALAPHWPVVCGRRGVILMVRRCLKRRWGCCGVGPSATGVGAGSTRFGCRGEPGRWRSACAR